MKNVDFLQDVAHLISKKDFNSFSDIVTKVRGKQNRETFIALLKYGFSVLKAIETTQIIFNITVKTKLTWEEVFELIPDFQKMYRNYQLS